MNIKESEITIPHHSTPATHTTLANHILLARGKKMDTWCEVIYNGTLVGPQGQFWMCHVMEMSEISPVEVNGLIMQA